MDSETLINILLEEQPLSPEARLALIKAVKERDSYYKQSYLLKITAAMLAAMNEEDPTADLEVVIPAEVVKVFTDGELPETHISGEAEGDRLFKVTWPTEPPDSLPPFLSGGSS